MTCVDHVDCLNAESAERREPSAETGAQQEPGSRVFHGCQRSDDTEEERSANVNRCGPPWLDSTTLRRGGQHMAAHPTHRRSTSDAGQLRHDHFFCQYSNVAFFLTKNLKQAETKALEAFEADGRGHRKACVQYAEERAVWREHVVYRGEQQGGPVLTRGLQLTAMSQVGGVAKL